MTSSISATATATDAKIAAVRLAAHEDICRERYEHIGERFDHIDRTLARHDREFEKVYRAFEKVDHKFEAQNRKISGLYVAAGLILLAIFFEVDISAVIELLGIVR
ncbi:MAG: hypothetical protein MPK08_00015 [Alphaproteobacteria bacterium]|nr:hypothetical protein [Alphaproteobacteria bacterium]MDA8003285.1 hypothetical protein [Alphaproteobacteria bacterium]MDA8013962.1 hypothetical protein [Alphaproteobacteria bacterium]